MICKHTNSTKISFLPNEVLFLQEAFNLIISSEEIQPAGKSNHVSFK